MLLPARREPLSVVQPRQVLDIYVQLCSQGQELDELRSTGKTGQEIVACRVGLAQTISKGLSV